MPVAQLVTAVLESAINKLLSMDEQSAERLRPLTGKQLKVDLRELPWPLTLVFNNHIEIQANSAADVDCTLKLSVGTLNKLQDSSQLTQLIQNRELELLGDIHVAQSFSVLIKDLDIDWEEQLSVYTGDVFAHQTMRTGKRAGAAIKDTALRFESTLRDAAIEEKALAPHPVAVEAFYQGVNQLRADVARFEARLSLFQQKRQR
ncbi:ubiquinone biosynthesis accessory factor UbiJ [Neptunicella sp. SCSIO 80796]|uniref:ubiquinone biosynthesis accessory factor UbiJ n=1 Tax=Neptunicella plasticusilytica TaxID=3117012 RepID=UPI003A4D6815